MKHWWHNIVKDYLTFSKRERNGLFFLFLMGVFIYFLPQFFRPKKVVIDKEAFQKDIAQLKISVDTSSGYTKRYNNFRDEERGDYFQPKRNDDFNTSSKGELFAFDPNIIDAAGWKKLGLRDKTISTIQKFTSKGFKFRKAEDIRRIYGLRPEEADRLIPFIKIAATENSGIVHSEKSYASNNTGTSVAYYPVTSSVSYKPKVIEINEADTAAYISLPGIGSKLAMRIVNFRDKLGGFFSVDQVGETYGVPDSTFQKIKPLLQCNNAAVKKININEADLDELKSHPYIRYAIANAIINFRRQHGNFKSINDIRQINIITDEVFSKITPYLIV